METLATSMIGVTVLISLVNLVVIGFLIYIGYWGIKALKTYVKKNQD